MTCKQGTDIIIQQMTDVLNKMGSDEYAQPLALFNGSSIGQHFRHIVDFYGCLLRGLQEGRIDYAQRQRDLMVETEPAHAAEVLAGFMSAIQLVDEGRGIHVVADFSSDFNEERPVIQSSVARELMYAYDHAVHHLAMIKMGLKAAVPHVTVDPNLGVAPSTIKHWQGQRGK